MLTVAATLVAAGAAIGTLASASVVPERSCAVIDLDRARSASFLVGASYTTDGFAMRRQWGESRCSFASRGEGACTVKSPGVMLVQTDRTSVAYKVPLFKTASIVVHDGDVRCTTR